jgi:hypothetical protein
VRITSLDKVCEFVRCPLAGRRHKASPVRNGKPNGVGTLTNGTDVIYGTWTNGCFRDATRKVSFGVPASTCR